MQACKAPGFMRFRGGTTHALHPLGNGSSVVMEELFGYVSLLVRYPYGKECALYAHDLPRAQVLQCHKPQ